MARLELLLVWIFAMRIVMIITSIGSYFINEMFARAKYEDADKMNFEAPLTSLVWLTSLVSIGLTFLVSWFLIGSGDGILDTSPCSAASGRPACGGSSSTIISCGTLAGAIIPEAVKVFTSTNSGHVREVVTASREGGASLNILAGLIAGNFSAYWMGLVIAGLMGIAYGVSTSHGLNELIGLLNTGDTR